MTLLWVVVISPSNFDSVRGSADFRLWTAYPIVWGLTEGANKITVDSEIIAYAVLDV